MNDLEQELMKEFDERIDVKSELGFSQEKSLLTFSSNHPLAYPESEYELDSDRVREFLKSAIHKVQEQKDSQFIQDLRDLQGGYSSDSKYLDGFEYYVRGIYDLIAKYQKEGKHE